jgi:hypothetical protein
MGRSTLALLAAVTLTACKNPVGVTASIGDTGFVLAPHVTASVGDEGLRVEFLRVSGDSRCPQDVVCIQGGDAVAHVRVEDARGHVDLELHTSDPARSSGSYRIYRVTLVDLRPFPFSGRTIPQADYRATLTVTR